jgi:hypothetical protein
MKRVWQCVAVVTAVLLLVTGLWLVPMVQHYLAEDRCLDAGGGIRAESDTCELDPPRQNYQLR